MFWDIPLIASDPGPSGFVEIFLDFAPEGLRETAVVAAFGARVQERRRSKMQGVIP